MSKRPPPPMYGRVRRKVAPPVHHVVVQQPALSDLEKQQQMQGKGEPTPAAAPSAPAPAAKKEAAKKEPAKKEPAKKEPAKKPKKPKWNEDMTQKELYQIAKKAGLDVKARDWKHEIVAALKKAGV